MNEQIRNSMNDQASNRFHFRAWFDDEKCKHMYYGGKLDRFGRFILRDIAGPLYGATVMQSTGTVDKNGQEIFEGDILEYEASEMENGIWRTVVSWYKDGLQWVLLETVDDSGYLTGHKYGSDPMDQAKVIGNIHENPELLDY